MKYPVLAAGQRNLAFRPLTIIAWFANAFLQCGITMTFVLVGAAPLAANHGNGNVWTHFETGVLLFSILILTVHLQIGIVFEQWTWVHHLSIYLSIGGSPPCTCASTSPWACHSGEVIGSVKRVNSSAHVCETCE
jgi:phospholipid-transporting ATPase